jgi:hypothetical protein
MASILEQNQEKHYGDLAKSNENTNNILTTKYKTSPNTDNKGKLLVTVFAPAVAGFRRFAPQLLLLHPRQIRYAYTAIAPLPV